MKNYMTLPKDYTSLITELTAYVQEAGKDQNTWFWTGTNTLSASEWAACCARLPSLTTTFADLNLTVVGFGHRFIHKGQQPWPNIFDKSTLTIPLTNDSFTVTTYQPQAGAKIVDSWYYLKTQCDKIESISSTEPMLVNRDVSYIMEPTEATGLISFLVIMLSGTDSLLAE